MAHEYKLPKITIDDAEAMGAQARLKTLKFEEEMRKTIEARGWSWNKKGWAADVLKDSGPKEQQQWKLLGSPGDNTSIEDIMGLRPRVRAYLKRHSHASGTGTSAVRTLRKGPKELGSGGRRSRKARKTRRSRK
jgi:hypothetical protein